MTTTVLEPTTDADLAVLEAELPALPCDHPLGRKVCSGEPSAWVAHVDQVAACRCFAVFLLCTVCKDTILTAGWKHSMCLWCGRIMPSPHQLIARITPL